MLDVLNLALPYFGLIFLGLLCGKLKQIPETGLAWMNFFLIYVSLPCLFYRVLALTPLEQLNNPRFILATVAATALMFALAFGIGWVFRRSMADATIAGLSGAYGNIGYMGPGLALATLGSAANVPVALIFCFDTLLVFALVPFLMALSSPKREGIAATALEVATRIALHPFIIATVLGVASAAVHFEPPVALDRLMAFLQNAAAPCALFTLGVTVALRPVQRIPWDVPGTIAVKLLMHPIIVLILLSLLGPFDRTWVYAAVLMAALPPALNVFIMARQYDTWVAQASGSVLFGTFVSVLTLTSVMFLVKSGMLPVTLIR
jgi:predicted permease